MALPSCKRCGKRDPQRMYGLMSLWFGPLVELEADLGYFYLCPACHDEFVAPELERIHNHILELHPAAARALDEMDMTAADAYADSLHQAEADAAEIADAVTESDATDEADGADQGHGDSEEARG